MPDLTPMQQQYQQIKQQHPNELLFFRLGDFYEMFGPDALEASRILQITLTARHKGSANEIPMCGVPHHAAEGYIAKLTKAGKRVAICEQVSDPSLPGIVNREVIRVVTPGTTLDASVLANNTNNYLVGLVLIKEVWGLALVDVTTGVFQSTEIKDLAIVKQELSRLSPAEVVVPAELYNDMRYREWLNTMPHVAVFQLPAYTPPEQFLKDHFKVTQLTMFGIADMPVAIAAAAGVLGYVKETQKAAIEHIVRLSRYQYEDYMVLDQATIRNLEIVYNAWTMQAEGSLVGVLDETTTAMGARLLRNWLLRPLLDHQNIALRNNAVAALVNAPPLMTTLIGQFKQMADFERLVGRIGCNRATARDLVALKNSLTLIPEVKKALADNSSALLHSTYEQLPDFAEVVALIEKWIVDEPPLVVNEGGMIRPGINVELDELRSITTNGKQWLAEFQAQEIKNTGISSLKVRFNSVFGYYIEVSKANMNAVPDTYIRKQTLVNAERYITPELKEYEGKILGAEEKINQIEYQLFCEVREKVTHFFPAVQLAAYMIAQLDVLAGFALAAKKYRYCQPVITTDGAIAVTNGRHPVIERVHTQYVPNDIHLDHDKQEFVLLTGPNMSGKSSYLRQVALITLMAQVGSFVPAEKATIGIVDRIFTRVGASDNVAQGVSTFMNEMLEAGNILHNATERSLIILDEIGRGTSTYDGLSIAWAISEYIHNNLKAKALFATHYHELVSMIETLPRAVNYCVAVTEEGDRVVFLHKIIKGASSQSYGIEVAKLAHLPKQVIERAQAVLDQLEQEKGSVTVQSVPQQQSLLPQPQRKCQELHDHLATIDPNNLTPLQALALLEELKKKNTIL